MGKIFYYKLFRQVNRAFVTFEASSDIILNTAVALQVLVPTCITTLVARRSSWWLCYFQFT